MHAMLEGPFVIEDVFCLFPVRDTSPWSMPLTIVWKLILPAPFLQRKKYFDNSKLASKVRS